jgi:hypothetical protein
LKDFKKDIAMRKKSCYHIFSLIHSNLIGLPNKDFEGKSKLKEIFRESFP